MAEEHGAVFGFGNLPAFFGAASIFFGPRAHPRQHCRRTEVRGIINGVGGEDQGAGILRSDNQPHSSGSMAGKKQQFQVVGQFFVPVYQLKGDSVQAVEFMPYITVSAI